MSPTILLRAAILTVEFLTLPRAASDIDRTLGMILGEGYMVARDPGRQAATDQMCIAI